MRPMGRSVRLLLAAVAMLVAGAVSFAAGAPAVVGAAFLVLMVVFGAAALVVMLRLQSQAQAFARQARQARPEKEPWDD
jgi:Ca2+/Na+ antiporter